MKKQLESAFNKFMQPKDSPIDDTNNPQQKYVPWIWGVKQGVQLKKIKSSTGYFKKLSAGAIGTVTNITGGTVTTSTITKSTFDTGTITNSTFQGTISQPVETGGTFTNPTVNTGTLNTSLLVNGTFNTGTIGTSLHIGGTMNNATFGTPSLTGGTYTQINLAGTASYPVTAGTQALTANNMFQLQTLTGSVILVVRSGGTNFVFTPSGTQ